MGRRYFGTDGIRGTVGEAPITADFVLRLGHAVGKVLKRSDPHPTVLIGKDTRLSGYMLESALESGFNSVGVDVVLLGPIPTPGVAYLTQAQRANLGVVISASHNPFADNGIKFFGGNGSKLDDAWEQAVEAAMEEPPQWSRADGLGRSRRLDDALGRYIEFCKASFAADLTLKGLRIVVDAAHGAAYQVAPKVFAELGAEVITIGCAPDGLNINHEVGANHPQAMVQAVRAGRADYGVALDGDADRLLMVDGEGRVFNGDELLYLMAADRLARDEPVPGVVGTLMSNMAVELALSERGVKFVRSRVGDRYVLEELLKHGWLLGGEGSGHLLALDRHSTGDGVISALQVLQACVRSGQTLSQLLQPLNLFPQILVNVRLGAGVDWQSNRALTQEIAAVESELGQEGRLLIRPSGTEPLLRIMVEARDAAQAKSCVERLRIAATTAEQT